MKTVEKLPPIIHQIYEQYKEILEEEEDLKKRKDSKKKQILAWLKKEQTDGYMVGSKKLIHIVESSPRRTVDAKKLESKYPSAYNDCLKIGNGSRKLLVS